MMCAGYLSTYGTCIDSAGEALIRILDFYANRFHNSYYGIYYNGSIVYLTLNGG